MATRFRFPSTGTAAISPATQSYTHGGSTRRPLPLADASALSTDAVTPDGADHLVDGSALHVQFVSDPLKAQTFTSGDAFKYAVQSLEAHANNNLRIAIWMGIVDSAGSAVGTIRSNLAHATEISTSLTNRFTSNTLTGTVSCSDNDRLVVEISVTGLPTATGGVQGHNASLRWGGDGNGGDLGENDTDTGTNLNPWLEFTNTIQFMPQPPAPTPPPPVRRGGLSTALIVAACAFVPVVASSQPAADAAHGGAQGLALAARVLQYQSIAGPVAIPTPPIIPDQWWPEYPDRHPLKRYPVSVGQSQFLPLISGTFPAADSGQGSSTGGVVGRRLLQYQSLAGPVAIVTGVAETITLDKWEPQYPDRAFPPKGLHASQQRAWVSDKFDAPAAVTVPDLSWGPRYPSRLVRKAPAPQFQALAWNTDTPAGPTQADAGQGGIQSGRVFPTRLVQYQSQAGPVSIAPVVVDTFTAEKFPFPQAQIPRKRQTHPAYGRTYTSPIMQTGEVSWSYPDSVPRAPRPAWFQAFALDRFQAPDPVITPDLSWKPVYPDRINPARALRTAGQRAWVSDQLDPPAVVVAPDLSWEPQYPDRLWSKARVAQFQALAWNPDTPAVVVETITLDKWEPCYPDRYLVRALHASQRQAWTNDRFDPPTPVVAPAITPAVYPASVPGHRPRLAGLFVEPVHVPDVTQPVVALSWLPRYPVTIDKPRTILAAQRQAWAMDRFADPNAIDPQLLTWQPEYPDRIWVLRLPRLGGSSVAPLYLADITVQAPTLSWRPAYPDIIWPPKALRVALQRAYQADKFEPPDVNVTPEVTVYARPLVGTVHAKGQIGVVAATAIRRILSNHGRQT